MGVFDILTGKGSAEEQEVRAEKRHVSYQKDLEMHKSAYSEDMTYISDQNAKADLLQWQQDLDDEMEKLKHRLRGYTKQNGEWVKSKERSLTNEQFINDIEAQVDPFMSRNLINSNFKEEHIYSMLRHTMHDIVDVMADGWDKYDIDFVNYDLVKRLIQNTIMPSPFRAINGWTKRTDSTMSKRIEAYSENPATERKRFLGLMGT